jgi:hypothetical protein
MSQGKPYEGTRFCIDCGLRVAALTTCSTTGDVHGPAQQRRLDAQVRITDAIVSELIEEERKA